MWRLVLAVALLAGSSCGLMSRKPWDSRSVSREAEARILLNALKTIRSLRLLHPKGGLEGSGTGLSCFFSPVQCNRLRDEGSEEVASTEQKLKGDWLSAFVSRPAPEEENDESPVAELGRGIKARPSKPLNRHWPPTTTQTPVILVSSSGRGPHRLPLFGRQSSLQSGPTEIRESSRLSVGAPRLQHKKLLR